MVLLHGWTLDRRMWEAQIEAFSASRRVVAIDRRGCGESGGLPDLARETDDLLALFDALLIQRAVLCGASQGGRLALRFAHSHPERVSALVLAGTSVDGMPEPQSDPGYIPLGEYAELARAGRMDEVRRRWLAHPMMRVPDGRSGLRDQITAMVADYRGEDLLAAPAPPAGILSRLSEIGAPALIACGAQESPHRKSIAQRLARDLPNARFVAIPDSGHLVNIIAPEAFNSEVNRWWITALRA